LRFAESPEYDVFASAIVESIEEDNDNLTFHREELAKRAKSEVRTKKLIREMALLVTEQQEDVEALRDEVDELKELVYELHDTIEDMRRGLLGSQQKKRRLQYDAAHSPMQQVTLPRTNRDVGVSEIDMFDDEIQLMQSD
jgi:predicted RNase H-like nuclease (RuvC/YqgF family)